MIAVVYSGSRFADWKLSSRGLVTAEFTTAGINPLSSDEKSISSLLNKNNELIINAEKIKRIYFFGAGASSPERKKVVSNAFQSFFRYGKVFVEHDLKAAALAASGDSPCIAATIGSGSNAAYYNGRSIKENNYGLGFILADEGSANWMGRQLLKDFLYGNLPSHIEKKFIQKYNSDKKQILEKVYRQAFPALYLSSFADFITETIEDKYSSNLVLEGFNLFFDKYIIPLSRKYSGVPLNFAGSAAAGFKELLYQAAEQHQLTINSVIKEPIYNVLHYYINKNQHHESRN